MSERNVKIKQILSKTKYPPYVYDQICEAIYKKGIAEYSLISNISKDLREMLTEELGEVLSLEMIEESGEDENVSKFLFKTRDGESIEAVRMVYKTHVSLCISSQVGCAMGCKFCVTGAQGFKRDLSCDEVVDQILYFKQLKIPVDTIIVSGMGEPLLNPNFFDALEIITDENFLGYGERKISVSTVGIIPGLKKLIEEHPQINIAFSLHSPFNEERASLMPITKTYPIASVMDVLDDHIAEHKRKVFLVYLLLKEVNDTKEHVQELVKLIKESGELAYLYHVNLMRFHPGDTALSFEPTDERVLEYFESVLDKNHINYTVRHDFGLGIEAACGQLRSRSLKKLKGRKNSI